MSSLGYAKNRLVRFFIKKKMKGRKHKTKPPWRGTRHHRHYELRSEKAASSGGIVETMSELRLRISA